jgi:multicomponent Na+:H+ antiporter subunit D
MSILIYFVVAPVAAAMLTALLNSRLKDRLSSVSSLTASSLAVLSFYCVFLVSSSGARSFKIGGWMPSMGISLVIDGFSGMTLVLVNVICFLILLYSAGYMRIYTEEWKFYSLFMLMLAGMNGVILSADIFNLYVFLEVTSIAGYVLVAFGIRPEDLEASFKYLIMGTIASILILLSIAFLYSYTSTLNMSDMAQAIWAKPAGLLINFVTVLLLAGFGLKAALVPFHAWLPDAHSSAPSPVSAALSGVVIKVLGIYALSRVFFNVVGASGKLLTALMFLGALSMIIGALLAATQSDIKRMFAYSSISQVGYIVFALGVGTPLAMLGALFHLFNHATAKSLLFLNAGAIEQATGTRDLNRMGGLNSSMPVAGFSSLMASMSISGMPPLAGFWSKLLIIVAAVQAGHIAFSAVAVITSIITLVYYLRFQTTAFFGSAVQGKAEGYKMTFGMQFSMFILGIICLGAGLLLLPSLRDFFNQGVDVLISGINYRDAILGAAR